jgi:hypothetical protein
MRPWQSRISIAEKKTHKLLALYLTSDGGGISFTNLIKVTNTMIAGPEGSTLPVRKPTTGHDSPHTHLIKHQTDSDNKVQCYKGYISEGAKKS